MASRSSGPRWAWRVADRRHPIFDGAGAMLHGARWNSPGRRVIYASETYAGALLEILVHASGAIPGNQSYIRIEVPAGLAIEQMEPADVPGWDRNDFVASREFGDRWYDSGRTPVLVVPSVVTRVEHNLLINQEHHDFRRISATAPANVRWDTRLWPKASPMH